LLVKGLIFFLWGGGARGAGEGASFGGWGWRGGLVVLVKGPLFEGLGGSCAGEGASLRGVGWRGLVVLVKGFYCMSLGWRVAALCIYRYACTLHEKS
jgi:hypothetical protein